MGISEIAVAGPILTDRLTVCYRLHASELIRRYFSSRRMFVKYDVDVTRVPEAILLIPFLATLAPIAWALEARLQAPVVDAVFWDALQRVQRSLRELYPALGWDGELRAAALVDSIATKPGERGALLFSGGVDSLASYVMHRSEEPLLVSIWGADVGLRQHRHWQQAAAHNRAFARDHGLDISVATSNFRTFFNHYQLRARFLAGYQNWYSGVQQGLALVGLCAPLTYVHGLSRVQIPATHTPDSNQPWGSHPTIENNLRWAHTEVTHDGYHLSRQMKLRLLAEYIREQDPSLQLRVCWGKGSNCSRCAKCCLTMVGLLLEGLDPKERGFRFDASTLSLIRRQLQQGRMSMNESTLWRWMEIQRRIPTRVPVDIEGLDPFFIWFQGVSLRHCMEKNHRLARTKMRSYLETRPEPFGRWIRQALGHPFP